jgi:hypothetical protein
VSSYVTHARELCVMAPIAFSTEVYLRAFDQFAVGCTFTPVKSNPGQPAYSTRGIYDTRPIDVVAMDGSIISEQQSILDIRELEFSVLPVQGDLVNIPIDCNGVPLGDFEIMDADTNGGGETTLVIRKVVTEKP